MKIKVGTTDDPNSTPAPPSSSNSFFGDQALHAGMLNNNFQRRSEIMGGSFDFASEAMIAREIEKRRIREEIVTAGLLRRRELEEEVIRELMLEREIAMRRAEGVLLVDSQFSLMASDLRGPILNRRDEFRFEERPSPVSWPDGGINGKSSLVNRPEGGVFGGFPFQRQPGATNEIAVKPVIDLGKRQAGSLVKPVNKQVTGTKRKLETVIPAADGTTSGRPIKKSEKEWSCALCQVKATSEQGLKDHLKGKKHKAKEKASLRTNKSANNNFDNSDPLPEVTEKSIENVEAAMDPELQHTAEEVSRKMNGGSPVDEKQTKVELKNDNSDFKFWCTICNVGTTGEVLMKEHRMGKQHMAMLLENGGGVIAIKTMPKDVQYVDATRKTAASEGKEVSIGNSDAQADGVESDQEEDADRSELETASRN